MSDFTTQLRFICESYAGLTTAGSPVADIDEVIERSRAKIFDFDYPIFDRDYKRVLESKIISHYYTQEIGQETVGLFKHRLKNKMREIMPYYNQLYESEKLKFDPFMNTEYTDVHNDRRNDSRTTTNSHDGETTVDGNTVNQHIETNENTRDSSHNSDTLNEQMGINKNDKTENKNGSLSGTDTHIISETDAITGTDTTTYNLTENHTPQVNKSTLVKHADTPLGSVDGVTGDNSNYLSDATETIENYQGSNGHDTDTKTGTETVSKNDRDVKTGENRDTTSQTTTDTIKSSDSGMSEMSDRGNLTESNNETGNSRTNGYGETTDSRTSSETGSSTAEETGEATSDYFGRMFGKVGSETFSEMLIKFRETFLNIDMQVIQELDNLFMLVW